MYVLTLDLYEFRLTLIDRELYKTRLEVLFKHYPSKAFDGRPWGELSEIILVRQVIDPASWSIVD
jgi:hypothetical protein